MDLDDIISLNDAAAELGISKETLRTQWRRGRFAAKLFGNTLITTRQETERYRRESLGQVGRPVSVNAGVATATGAAHDATVLAVDGRTTTRQTKVKPTREPGT